MQNMASLLRCDINLNGKEWTPIGTKERPWTGEFNGNGKKLINFTSSKPLFGICDNATIKNVVIDETSEFEYVGQFSDDLYLATLATEIRNNTVVELFLFQDPYYQEAVLPFRAL